MLSKFKAGEFDYIDSASEMAECDFFRYIGAKKYLDALASTYPSPRVKEEVPRWFYIASNLSMRLHGEHSFNAFPYLVRTGGMLQAFGPDVAHRAKHPETGDTTLSCAGFNSKNDFDRQTPCDQDFLRKFSKDTNPVSLESWFNVEVAKIFKLHKAFDRDGIFIGDASYVFVPDNENYEGSVKLLFDPSGHPISSQEKSKYSAEFLKRCEWKRCYKLVSLLHTNKARSFTLRIAMKLLPGNMHESPTFYTLLEEFLASIGDGVVKRLLLDRGFLDGEKISYFKRTHGIDFLIPIKSNMDLYADAIGLIPSLHFTEFKITERVPVDQPALTREVPEKIWKREQKRQETLRLKKGTEFKVDDGKNVLIKKEVARIDSLTTFNSCDIPVHLIVNRDTHGDGEQKIWMLLDTRPIESDDDAIGRRKEYKIRTEIEEGHRQLKCFWDLTKFTSRSFSLILNQIVFTLLTFNLLQLWLKSRNELGDDSTDMRKTRMRMLRELLPTENVIVIYCENHFITMTPLEYTELLLTLDEEARVKVLEKTKKLKRNLSQELKLVRR